MKKKILCVVVTVVLFFIVVITSVFLLPSEKETALSAVIILGVAAMMTGFPVFFEKVDEVMDESKKKDILEIKQRFLTHSVMLYLSEYAIIFLSSFTSLPTAAVFGVAAGAYALVYYVFGAVQIPLNIVYRGMGYRKFYSLFYPLLSKRRRELLLFGGKEQRQERFSFDANGKRGEMAGDFFYVTGREYGGVVLPDKYLDSEFVSSDWSGEDFSALAERLGRYGVRAVGYNICRKNGQERVNIFALPDAAGYKKAKAELNKFFKKRGIAAETFLLPYDDFENDVRAELLPYPVQIHLFQLYTDKPFCRERVDFESKVQTFLLKDALRKNFGVAAFRFMVGFPTGTKYADMKKFVLDAEKDGFLCDDIFCVEKKEELGEDTSDELFGVIVESRTNYVHFSKLLNLNPCLTSAEIRLSWALSVYHNYYAVSMEEYMKSGGRVTVREKDEKKLRFAEKMIVSLLQSIRSEAEDDLMFSADSLFSFDDFKEAGLIWVSGRKNGWVISNETPKIRRIFEIVNGMEKKLPEEFDASELTEAMEKMYAAAVAGGALSIVWEA